VPRTLRAVKFCRYKIKVSHHHQICNCKHKNIPSIIFRYTYNRCSHTLYTPYTFDVCTVHCWVVHKNQHCALSFVSIFITNAAPTCFGTYVPSSGSVFVLVSTWKLRELCTVSGNVNLRAGLWCCTVGKHNTVQHHIPAHRAHKFTLPEAVHSCLSFHVLTRTKTLPEDGT
jgi:hypothetical protein